MSEQTRFRTYLAAKFAREKMPNPSDWLIVPDRAGWLNLVPLRKQS
jgi:hypothetical protein